MIRLFQVHASNFTAGFCVDTSNTIWKSSPILRWMEDKPLYVAESYCKKRGWKLIEIPNDARKEKAAESSPAHEEEVPAAVLEESPQG